jgi:hypothetical protein
MMGGAVRVNAGIASFLFTSLPLGVHPRTPEHPGDANTLGSTSAAISQAITGEVIIEITGHSNGINETTSFRAVVNRK